MSVTVLSDDNFYVMGNKIKTLMLNIPGNVLVLFKAQDMNSNQFQPVFNSLVSSDHRVAYADIDLNYNRRVINMSRDTTTPISGVPLLIMYINQKPYSKFNGNQNIQALSNFITTSLQSVITPTSKSQFMASPAPMPNTMYPPSQAPQLSQYSHPGAGYIESYAHAPANYYSTTPQNWESPGSHSGQRSSSSQNTTSGRAVMPPTNVMPPHGNQRYVVEDVSEEQEPFLSNPDGFVPHNTPWVIGS